MEWMDGQENGVCVCVCLFARARDKTCRSAVMNPFRRYWKDMDTDG